jgi:hypothetical protein
MSVIPDHPWTREGAQKVKLLIIGGGDEHSRILAFKYLTEVICACDQIGFDPENAQLTAFNAGRKWVARQLQIAAMLPVDKLAGSDDRSRSDGTDKPAGKPARIAGRRRVPRSPAG